MIKYWNNREGINWLDLKKKKKLLLGMFPYKPNTKVFFLWLRRIFLKVTVPWGTQKTYSLARYTHGKEINGLQSPKGPLTLGAGAVNSNRRFQSIPQMRSLLNIFQFGCRGEIWLRP